MNDFIYDVIYETTRWLLLAPLKLFVELCLWVCAIGFLRDLARAGVN